MKWFDRVKAHAPADTRRNNNATITPKRRRNVVFTSKRRRDVAPTQQGHQYAF